MGSFVALQRVLEPRADHVLVVREETTRRGEKGSGAPPLLGRGRSDAEESLHEGTEEPIIELSEGTLFVPAPPDMDEPAYGFELQEIPLYAPEVIAEAVLSAEGMKLVQGTSGEWVDWKARWELGERFIEISLNALPAVTAGDDPVLSWESSLVSARCTSSELLSIWTAICSRCPGVWLADPERPALVAPLIRGTIEGLAGDLAHRNPAFHLAADHPEPGAGGLLHREDVEPRVGTTWSLILSG